MNEIAKTRIKLIVAILIVIALAHVVVIKMIVPSKPKEEEPAKTEKVEETKKPVVTYRYRKPSENPNFGKDFDRSTAVDGNLANLPLSAGATSGFMVDLDTRKVLWMKNPGRSVPIASMVKMMTLLVAFEELEKRPDWSLEMPVQITAGATKVARTGIIWLDTRESMPLGDLMKAAAIKSANDAAYQIAETVGGGDIAAFIAKMNRRAAELKMPGTSFVSPNGLPSKANGNTLSTAEGMVILGERLLEYPPMMEWASTKQTFIRGGKTELTTTNKLINPHWPGVDGLKTGYTNDAGSCLTFTALRNGKRVMGCVTGFGSSVDRDRFCRKLIDWGYERAAEIDAGKLTPPAAGPVTAAAPKKAAAPAKATAKPAAKQAASAKKKQ